MEISISDRIAEKFPDLSFVFLAAMQCSDYESDQERGEVENEIVGQVLSDFSKLEIENHEFNKCYLNFYKSMGLKAKKCSTPLKQVLRIIDNEKYRSVHRVIDECMKVEYSTLVSFQIYDLDKISGGIRYRLATGEETLTDFHNNQKVCKEGELILEDDESVMHSVYYGNHKHKSVDKGSSNYLIRVMKVPGVPFESLEKAIKKIMESIPQSELIFQS